MSEAQHISETLDSMFLRPQNGWFTPFTVAITGLTAEQAARVPAEGFNSVWGVVNHVRLWHEYVLARLRGTEGLRTDEDWRPPDEPADDEAWRADCARAIAVNSELAAFVAGMSDAELTAAAPGKAAPWQLLQGLIAHNAYHTCEVISIRHMQGLWVQEV